MGIDLERGFFFLIGQVIAFRISKGIWYFILIIIELQKAISWQVFVELDCEKEQVH